MYEVNPHKSKTDDLGMGQGLAQVIDPNLRLQYYKLGVDAEERDRARQEKQEAAKEAQIERELSKLGNGVWVGVDDERIGNKINNLSTWTEENIDKLRKGDIGATVEFNNLKREIANESAMSNKQMKDYYATRLKTANNLGNYYDDEIESYNNYGNTQRDKISDLPSLNQRFNTNKYYSDLGLKQKQEADLQGRKRAISPQEADVLIANDLTVNAPALIAESKALKSADEAYLNSLKTSAGQMLTKNENLVNQDPSKYKLATVTDFAQARHGKSIYGQWTTPAPATPYGGAANQLNLTITRDSQGNIVNADPQYKGGQNTKGKTIIPINGQDTEVLVTNAKGTPENPEVIVKFPTANDDNEKKRAQFDKDRKAWKDDEDAFKFKMMKLEPENTGNKVEYDKQRSEYYKTVADWYKNHPYPKEPRYEMVQTTLKGDEARRAWDNAYSHSIESALTGKGVPANVQVFHSKENTQNSEKKDFNALSKQERQSLQKQSGAKNSEEFVIWLRNNGY